MQTGGEEICLECPANRLDDYLISGSGRRLGIAIELDRQKELVKLQLRTDEVTYLESMLLSVIAEERDKYQEEMIREASQRRGN